MFFEIKDKIEKIKDDEKLKKLEDPFWRVSLSLNNGFGGTIVLQASRTIMTKENLEQGKFAILRLYVSSGKPAGAEDLQITSLPGFYFFVAPPFE